MNAAGGVSQETARLPVLAEARDIVATAAAWPVGASQLAIAHEVVRRDKDVEVRCDWVASAK